ncbi:MAG TPA: peptidoglycan-binding domain-containing protein [Leptolyngbyaceae cyanobacterium]
MAFNISVLKLPTLKKGSSGSTVRAWQNFLKEAEYPIGKVDGIFGNTTEQLTRSYQQRNSLPVNGVVDNTTYTKALTNGFIYKVPNLTADLLLSYLRFGEAEVKDLQKSLNTIITPDLTVDGDFGSRSTQGLAQAYLQRDVRLRDDFENKLSSATQQKLGADFNLAMDILTGYAKRIRFRLSGPHWVDYFPTARSISDLASPFREKVQAFQKALIDAGAQTIIAATYRPKERAYLMHYSARIDRGQIAPEDVPSMAGVDIEWVHYTKAGSLQAAELMVEAYGTGGNPVALESRHTQKLAIDWNITWKGTLKIKKKDGSIVSIGNPPNGANNIGLHAVGTSYGVFKLLNDPPHWSSDGR